MPEPAGRLGAALDQVAGDRGAGQPCPVVPAPSRNGPPPGPASSEASATRPVTTIRAPGAQCLGDRPRPEVDIGGHQPRGHDSIDRLAGLEVGQVDPLPRSTRGSSSSTSSPVTTPIAISPSPAVRGSGRSARRARRRIQPPGVGDDPQLPVARRRIGASRSTSSGKSVTIAGRRVLGPQMAQDRHRQLGQVLERQHVDLAVARQQIRRIEVVAPEAGAVADREAVSIPLGSIEASLILPGRSLRRIARLQT